MYKKDCKISKKGIMPLWGLIIFIMFIAVIFVIAYIFISSALEKDTIAIGDYVANEENPNNCGDDYRVTETGACELKCVGGTLHNDGTCRANE